MEIVPKERGQPIMTSLPGLPRFEGQRRTLFVTFLIFCVTNNALCQVLNGAAYGMTIILMFWGRFDKKHLRIRTQEICTLNFRLYN